LTSLSWNFFFLGRNEAIMAKTSTLSLIIWSYEKS
jgi:hypothetical protein